SISCRKQAGEAKSSVSSSAIAPSPAGSAGRKAGFKPGQKIVDMLQPDGKPKQAVADAGPGARLRSHVDMRHRRRMGDEALHPAERFGKRDDLDGPHEALHSLHAAGKLEAHHGAEALLLAPGERMVRMVGKAGIVHAGDGGMG